MKGMILKSTGSWYQVLHEESNHVYACRTKGKFRMEGIQTTNPIAVGDYVDFKLEEEDDSGIITKIHDRKNYIIRKSIKLSKQYHIIASNVDQLALIVTLVAPQTTTTFIDRYLATAEAYRIPAILVFNKIDLYEPPELEYIQELKNVYEKIGYSTIGTSAKSGTGINRLKKYLKDKKTLVSGHSGVGKSSLANAMDPGLELKTGKISINHLSGKHTTTFAEMHPLSFGGFIIDTPGIKSFAPADMQKDKIYHYFPEIFKWSKSCKFHNCLHINEPKCAVKKALDENEIAIHRYVSYLSMFEEDENQKYRKDIYT